MLLFINYEVPEIGIVLMCKVENLNAKIVKNATAFKNALQLFHKLHQKPNAVFKQMSNAL